MPLSSQIFSQTKDRENPLISSDKLKQLYSAMLKLRLGAERPHSRNGSRRASPRFQEACEVGCSIDLNTDDTLILLPHQHLGNTTTAGRPLDFQSKCFEEECRFLPKLVRPRLPHRLAFATGLAFAQRMQEKKDVVVAFHEATELSGSRELLRFAADSSLPIIYVQLGNSQRSVDVVQKRSSSRVPVLPVDGGDVVAVYRVAYEAMDKARRGDGPTIIHSVRYSSPSPGNAADDPHSKDPLVYMERYLRKRKLWSDDFKRSIEEDFLAEKTIKGRPGPVTQSP